MENCQYFDAINVYYFVNTKIDAFWLKLQIEQNINLTISIYLSILCSRYFSINTKLKFKALLKIHCGILKLVVVTY